MQEEDNFMNDITKILFVEDEKICREDAQKYFEERVDIYGNEYEFHVATNIADALSQFEEIKHNAIICDLDMTKTGGGEFDGLEFLKKIREQKCLTPFVMFTCTDAQEVAEKCFVAGVDDYMVKTNINWEGVLFKLKLIMRLKEENQYYKDVGFFNGIITKNEIMFSLIKKLSKIAPTDTTITLVGESGTGKEMFAQSIQRASNRSGNSFISVNISSLPEGLIEAEMFGHAKGAFTGAERERIGRFELAHKGTIFLDEIGDLPMPLQVKFLRVLEEREINRIGNNATIPVDIRIIAATNRDLKQLVRERRFREDLLYRLGDPLYIPPLRKRREDILILINHFIKHYNSYHGRTIIAPDNNALGELMSHNWPGNVRELKNVVERAVILCGEII